MRKDPTEFRKRFAAWKNGKQPYKDGKPVTVGEYKVYPSAIGASELNVTTPEIVVTGKDRRPLYQRYDAYNSTYDPNLIRNFTDWLPVAGDVQQGVQAVDEYNKGNYLYSGILGASLFLPNVIEKPLKSINKGLKNILLDYQFANAIKHKHIQTLRRLRDQHFIDNAPNTVVKNQDGSPKRIFHGTYNQFDKYNPSMFGSNSDDGFFGVGLYGSESLNVAKKYGDKIKEFYANIQAPFRSGAIPGKTMEELNHRAAVAAQFNRGGKIGGYIVDHTPKNIIQELENADGAVYHFFDERKNPVEFSEIVIPTSQQLKYSAPITRDNNGKLIPLSKRDDFLNPDFRY